MKTSEQHLRSLSQCSDAELVIAARAGQLQAFGELVARSEGLARAVAYSATGNAASVEDMVQEALVTAWTRLGDLSDPSAFRPWLAGIVRNTVRYWRRHQRRHAPLAQAGMDTISQLPSAAPSPFEQARSQQDWQHTREALMSLSEKYREALLLYYSLSESYERVAEALAIAPANARQRVHRARKKLASEAKHVASTGRRLGNRASAAAGILVAIEKRDAWAAGPASTPALSSPATSSALLGNPKVFLGIGALGGAAIVAAIAAVVMLIGGERESIGATTAEREMPPAVETTPGDRARPGTANGEPHASLTPPAGMVRMGHGNVGDRTSPAPAIEALPVGTTLSTSTPPSATGESAQASARLRNHRGSGHIRKHGPAVVVDEPTKPLRMPDIDMQAVRRERWQ